MNKKILALIVVLIAIVGFYGLVYAATTSILIPMDSSAFKSELNTLETPLNNDTSIAELESGAEIMESASLAYTSQSERTQMANTMRLNNAIPPSLSNQNFANYDNLNSFKMILYDFTFRGDISDQMKNLTTTRNEIIHLNNVTISITQKMSTDFENGDNKAYAADMRNLANIQKQYNNVIAKYKIQLQKIIQMLGG